MSATHEPNHSSDGVGAARHTFHARTHARINRRRAGRRRNDGGGAARSPRPAEVASSARTLARGGETPLNATPPSALHLNERRV
jgi:hypothetical protein